MKVLIVTHSEDNDSPQRICEALRELGAEPLRLDTDRFPTEVRLSCGLEGDGQRLVLREPGRQEVDLRQVEAVWFRRFYPGKRIPDDLDPQLRRPSVEESRRTLLGLLASLDAFVLDPHERVRHASNKQLQLRIAQELGLTVPDTLITNDPRAVRRFAARHPQGIVTKMQASFAVYDREGREQVVFTNPVGPEDLADLEGLELSPMTFQERVPKELELRVTAVGRRLFTAAVDSQASLRARDDWRRDGAAQVDSWRQHALPRQVGSRLLDLCGHLGLQYGAIDLILTPEGRWVFLEINPVGEYLWLEIHPPHFPVSRALAEVLVDPNKRRPLPNNSAFPGVV